MSNPTKLNRVRLMASTEIFSKLPDDMREKIMSCLNLKQRATASLVSRKWHHIITSLEDHKFMQTHPSNKYCRRCYRDRRASCRNCYNLHPPIIKLAADNTTVTELYLFVPLPVFTISFAAFESRLLTILHLKYCRIHDNDDIKEFPCLKEIYFVQVFISPPTFSNFIRSCPSIVDLTLKFCCFLKSISVPHLNQLKKVRVNCRTEYVKTIEIKARNLLEFHLFESSPLALDLHACTKLQVMNLNCANIPRGFPHEVYSAFPCLKSLSLPLCEGLNKIKYMSPELESLSLIDRLDSAYIYILCKGLNGAKLHWFKLFDSFKFQNSRALVGSKLMEVEIGLKYFRATNRFNKILFLESGTTESKEVISHSGNLQSNVGPLCIKNINLGIILLRIPRYEYLIDELFSYFHPRTMLVRVDSDAPEYDNFIQVLLDELKDWEKKSKSRKQCKHSNNLSCHYLLKGFKILESTTRQLSLEFQWHLN